jgi:membrane protein
VIDKIKQKAKESWEFLKFLNEHFVEDSCQTTAAALTYQTLFAVVPALTVMYTVLSAFDSFGGMGKTVENFIFANVVPENVAVVQDYLHSFSKQAQNLSIVSLVFLAITATLMLFTIERTFNEIWRIKEPRQGFPRLMMYWAVLTLGPVLFVLGIAATTYVLSLPLISDVTDSPMFLNFLPLILSSMMLTLIYIAVPNTRVPLRHAALGGILVSMVFEAAKALFGYIMAKSEFQVIYGTFAVVPLFLLWIYISWTIVLLGAELVKGLGVYRFQGNSKLEEPLFQMLIILEVFNTAHHQGEVVTDSSLRSLGSRINLERWTEYRHKLMELKLIRSVDRGGLMLSKDLSEITLWELYKLLPWPLPAQSHYGDTEWEKKLSETFTGISGRNRALLDIDLETLYLTPEKLNQE